MKKILGLILLLIIISTSPAYAHKLISHDDSHRNFEQALVVPDHQISWAIYENLGANEAKFYKFSAKHGESFYASIVIPKISGLEDYSPTMALIGHGIQSNDSIPFETSNMGVKRVDYQSDFPGREFYEPFGQITYWERQELTTTFVKDGEYYIIVFDEKNQNGKYSLAIGTIEDFSFVDFFTILPKAWFETKIFANDYFAMGVFVFFVLISTGLAFLIIRKRKRTKIRIS